MGIYSVDQTLHGNLYSYYSVNVDYVRHKTKILCFISYKNFLSLTSFLHFLILFFALFTLAVFTLASKQILIFKECYPFLDDEVDI